MDKEEFRIKLEEINRLVEQKNYKDAMEVVDSIDWRRVKNVHTLCVVGEIYAATSGMMTAGRFSFWLITELLSAEIFCIG